MDNGDSPDGGVKRACDQCRTRKIRCDKDSPCSNCRIAQRSCSSTGVGQKPKETRQRVLISTQYERKIDHFGDRLTAIEGMLRDLTATLGRANLSSSNSLDTPGSFTGEVTSRPGSTFPSSAAAAAAAAGGAATTISPSQAGDASTVFDDDAGHSDDEVLETAFEGSSSMTAQTAMASEFLEHAVSSTSLQDVSPGMQSALLSLQQIVGMQRRQKSSVRESRFVHQKPLPKGGLRELPMPPTQVVVGLLREIKDNPPVTFTLICAFIAVEDFTDACRKVYFATEDFSPAVFIIVNAGLFYLFQEKSMQNAARAPQFVDYHFMCRDNLETALGNMPLLMTPRRDNIEALLLGASYAVEASRFTLAWQLNSAAAMMCMTLGWHRLPSMQDEATDTKSALFWFAYMLDKGLSLRFGRSSVLQDYDISMPKMMGRVNLTDPWRVVLNLWITHAELMGRAYEQLYSPSALARPPEQRVESARQLIAALKQMQTEGAALSQRFRSEAGLSMGGGAATSNDQNTIEIVMKSDEVSYWASMTLIYRAIPSAPGFPSTFNTECIEAARMAFECHQECIRLTDGSLFTTAGYLHWTILYAPFIPFISLFCHVIETSDADDLRRLSKFVDSLQPVVSVSEAIEKLHRVCQVLYNVARLYVEAKAQQQQDHDMNMVGNNFDMYLSQLGFMPSSENTASHGLAGHGTGFAGAAGEVPVDGANQSLQLGDWFSGNRHIMGLMEEDLSQFSPGVWTAAIGGP